MPHPAPTSVTEEKPQEKSGRKRRSVFFWLSLFLSVAVAAGVAGARVVWLRRIELASRWVRKALDREGLHDACFRLARLSSDRVVVEGLCLGEGSPVFSVDWAEARFSYPDILMGRLDRLRIRGVRVPLVVEPSGGVRSPLAERIQTLAAARAEKTAGHGAERGGGLDVGGMGVGELSVYDVQVPVADAEGKPVMLLRGDLSAVCEPQGDASGAAVSDRYRIWAVLRDDVGSRMQLDGTVEPASGRVTLTPELKVSDAGALFERARHVVPDMPDAGRVVSTNGGVTLRGTFSVDAWTNVGPFEASAELRRGSSFAWPAHGAFVRFQSMRVDVSGTPRDVQCRVSVGVGGFKGGRFQASQEEGRMLSLRGSARWRQTITNETVTAVLDSDLPGRSIAKVLPDFLPVFPVFFSDGGTLRTEADLARAAGGLWQGLVGFKAEALRSSVPLAAGRCGAAAVRVEGALAVAEARPGALRMKLEMSEGYFLRRDLSLRGGVEVALAAVPPYAEAEGTFKGALRESVLLPQRNVSLPGGAIPVEGQAVVTGLLSNPVWQVSMRVPEFGVSVTQATARVQAVAGAALQMRYGADLLAAGGEAWVRDVAVAAAVTGGVGRAGVRFEVPEFALSCVTGAVTELRVCVSNGWFSAGQTAVLEGFSGEVPLRWSAAEGVAVLPGQRLGWERLEAQGIAVENRGFTLGYADGQVQVGVSAGLVGSAFGAVADVRLPAADPMQFVAEVSVPETELTGEDVLAVILRGNVPGVAVTGRVGAEARLRMLGRQPHVVGRLRMGGGVLSGKQFEVKGVALDVPFESGVFFRTIERPVVSFVSAKAGNVRMEKGRVAFQMTPEGVFIDRMEVGWCKGSLNAYSVRYDFKNPKDDFIVYADRIDLGEALMMVFPFRGVMEGVLYGRIPVGFDHGKVRLATGFLYSLPGQSGKVVLEDNRQMLDLLGKAGIRGDVQVPLSKALSDMEVSMFKMDLEPKEKGDGTLRIRLAGKSNFNEWPAPVDLNLNFHGPLEQLLNIGLDMSRK